jgi:hypothetical protein
MFRSFAVALLAAVQVLSSTAVAGATGASSPSAANTAASQESENPITDQGGNYQYRSYINKVTPNIPGLKVQVLEFADRLQLNNQTGQTVTVYGYSGEPYARVLAGGAVQLNTRSPAYYLNQSFYAAVTVPSSASSSAAPNWSVIDRTSALEWHDHRIHWMSPVPPSSVKDKSTRTKIFDWRVPIQVGSRKGAIEGVLFWTPENSKTPTGAIVALVVIVLAGLALVFFVRKRRRGSPGSGPANKSERTVREAW